MARLGCLHSLGRSCGCPFNKILVLGVGIRAPDSRKLPTGGTTPEASGTPKARSLPRQQEVRRFPNIKVPFLGACRTRIIYPNRYNEDSEFLSRE